MSKCLTTRQVHWVLHKARSLCPVLKAGIGLSKGQFSLQNFERSTPFIPTKHLTIKLLWWRAWQSNRITYFFKNCCLSVSLNTFSHPDHFKKRIGLDHLLFYTRQARAGRRVAEGKKSAKQICQSVRFALTQWGAHAKRNAFKHSSVPHTHWKSF